MHTLARFPAREARLIRQVGNRAFTLIELLTVIAIIAILAAITFGVVKGVNERAAIGQAKAELAVLAQALESYKQLYGDYPKTGAAANAVNTTPPTATDAPGILFNSLMGKLGPYVEATSSRAAIDGKRFVEASRLGTQLTTDASFPVSGNTTAVANAFIDPWGRRYLYYYKSGTSSAWTTVGYVLYSVGPDGLHSAPNSSTGVVDYAAANNLDNIYSGGN